jgi:tetratricopeptide (TPR) repeat protein
LVESGHFDVLERGRLDQVAQELGLAQSGMLDERNAAKIGRMAGLQALIVGDVGLFRVEDERTRTPLPKTKIVGYQTRYDKKGKAYDVAITQDYTVYAPTVIRRGQITVAFRVVDVETARVVAAKNANARWEGVNIVDPEPHNTPIFPSHGLEKSGPLPAVSAIIEQLAESVALEMAAQIAPHVVQEQRVWKVTEKGEAAFRYLNAGLPGEAQVNLKTILDRLETDPRQAKTIPSALYYDLGLLYEMNGQLGQAEQMYKQATALEMDETYLRALSHVRQAMEDRRALIEQQGAKK